MFRCQRTGWLWSALLPVILAAAFVGPCQGCSRWGTGQRLAGGMVQDSGRMRKFRGSGAGCRTGRWRGCATRRAGGRQPPDTSVLDSAEVVQKRFAAELAVARARFRSRIPLRTLMTTFSVAKPRFSQCQATSSPAKEWQPLTVPPDDIMVFGTSEVPWLNLAQGLSATPKIRWHMPTPTSISPARGEGPCRDGSRLWGEGLG